MSKISGYLNPGNPGAIPPYYILLLNGLLGGEITQKVIIDCQFASENTGTWSGTQLAIADIAFPTSSNGTATCIIEVKAENVYFRDDAGSFAPSA